MTEDNEPPLEGEITGPDGSVSPAPAGKGKGGKQPGREKRTSFNGRQTPEQRKDEEERSEPFRVVAFRGEGWWRGDGWEPSNDDRLMVQMLKFSGYTDEDIASALHMSVETLLKHFSWELKNAKTLIVGDLATRAYTRARQGNDIMTMFLLKTRGNGQFSEKSQTAAAITDSLKDVEGLSDDKKAEVIASLVDLLNPKKEKTKTATREGDGE